MKIDNKNHLALGLIILLGLSLRLVALFKSGNFWDDEIFNFIYSQKAWPQGLVYWLWETNPPLHMLILKVWFFVFPANELFSRIPSVIAGCASIYFIYKLGKDLFNEKAALISAFYLSIHPYHIFWSATARIYVFFMLLAILSTHIIYKQFFLGEASRKIKIYGAVVNGLLIFSHLSSLFFLTGQFFVLAIFKGKTAAINWIKYNFVPFVLGAGWIGLSIYIKRNNSMEKAWFLNLSNNLQESLNPLLNILVGQFNTIPGLILIILSLILIIYKVHKSKSINLLFLLTLISIPLMLSVTLGVWHIKFIIAVLPLLVLALAYALSDAKTLISLAIITSVCSVGLFNLWKTLPITDWKKIESNFTSYENSDKFIFVYNHFVLKPQVDRYLPTNISQNAKTLILYKDLDWDNMIVQKNYIPTKLSEEEKNRWYKENNLENYSIAVLLQNEFPTVSQLNDLFESKGWKLKQEPIRAQIVGVYNLYIYVKN